MPDLFASNTASAQEYGASDIEVLEGLEPVRKRPGMYIGGTDERALHHLVSEILDNSMDEAVAGHADWIEMHLQVGNIVTIRDNGRGIPVDEHPKYPGKSALEVIMTTLHSGGKFSNKAYQTSGGLHGVGISVVNALSDKMWVEVARDKNFINNLSPADWRKGLSRIWAQSITDAAQRYVFILMRKYSAIKPVSNLRGCIKWCAQKLICSPASRFAGNAM